MEEIRDILRKFNEERSWGRFHTPENLAKSISIEAGELLECFQWNNEYDREALCDEIADVMLYCIMLADAIDADLKAELLRKIKKNGEKYHVDKSRGSSAKYNELQQYLYTKENGMSRSSEKIFREMQKLMEQNEFESEEQANAALQELIAQYNESLNSNIDREPETPWDYLDMAMEAPTEKEALKYAKKALELDEYCPDAEVMIADIQYGRDPEKFKKKLEKIIAKTEKHLREEDFFDEDCIGDFWEIFETRPYMRARHTYVELLVALGKYKKAIEECEEMLELNSSDNTGIRYTLMGLYAHFENEVSAVRLYKKYNECSVHMLLPLIALYYKTDSYKTAEKYLGLIRGEGFDDYFLDFDDIYDDEEDYDDVPFIDGYCRGSEEEVAYAIEQCSFLYISTPGVLEWIGKKVNKDY